MRTLVKINATEEQVVTTVILVFHDAGRWGFRKW
jgi:hypothetical protein